MRIRNPVRQTDILAYRVTVCNQKGSPIVHILARLQKIKDLNQERKIFIRCLMVYWIIRKLYAIDNCLLVKPFPRQTGQTSCPSEAQYSIGMSYGSMVQRKLVCKVLTPETDRELLWLIELFYVL